MPIRRDLVAIPVAAVLILAAVLFYYSDSALDGERFRNIINHHHGTNNHKNPQLAPLAKISRLHYLIPASQPNLQLCYNLASSAANRYPVPTILGFNGTGEYDAAQTHLAKVRTIKRYLEQLNPDENDDLVLIVDGYDVVLQLPPEIMIERYFNVVTRANARLAKRFGLSVPEAQSYGLRETIFWGPDKICWPIDPRESRCWAAPPSSLPLDAWGPSSGSGPFVFADPRWLNSGTVIGPVDELRILINATMGEIQKTYDPEYDFKESDQYYISNIWGRQEYYRSLALAGTQSVVEGGPDDRIIPWKHSKFQTTEYHMGIEYESSLFQTKAGNEPFYDYVQFDAPGLATNMNIDMFGEGDAFNPYEIGMPANVFSALSRLYDSIDDSDSGLSAGEWIRSLPLGVNFVTRNIFPLWHCTGPKEDIDVEFTKMWYYPLARSLIKASVKAFQLGEMITTHLVNGRKWVPKNYYPSKGVLVDELGGAYTDLDGGQFLNWDDLCGPYAEILFGGQQGLQSPIYVDLVLTDSNDMRDDLSDELQSGT